MQSTLTGASHDIDKSAYYPVKYIEYTDTAPWQKRSHGSGLPEPIAFLWNTLFKGDWRHGTQSIGYTMRTTRTEPLTVASRGQGVRDHELPHVTGISRNGTFSGSASADPAAFERAREGRGKGAKTKAALSAAGLTISPRSGKWKNQGFTSLDGHAYARYSGSRSA